MSNKKQSKPQQYRTTITTTPGYANPNPTNPSDPFDWVKPEKRAEVVAAYAEIYRMCIAAGERAEAEEKAKKEKQ